MPSPTPPRQPASERTDVDSAPKPDYVSDTLGDLATSHDLANDLIQLGNLPDQNQLFYGVELGSAQQALLADLITSNASITVNGFEAQQKVTLTSGDLGSALEEGRPLLPPYPVANINIQGLSDQAYEQLYAALSAQPDARVRQDGSVSLLDEDGTMYSLQPSRDPADDPTGRTTMSSPNSIMVQPLPTFSTDPTNATPVSSSPFEPLSGILASYPLPLSSAVNGVHFAYNPANPPNLLQQEGLDALRQGTGLAEALFGYQPGEVVDIIRFVQSPESNASVAHSQPSVVTASSGILDDSYSSSPHPEHLLRLIGLHEGSHAVQHSLELPLESLSSFHEQVRTSNKTELLEHLNESEVYPFVHSGGHAEQNTNELFASLITSLHLPDWSTWIRQSPPEFYSLYDEALGALQADLGSANLAPDSPIHQLILNRRSYLQSLLIPDTSSDN